MSATVYIGIGSNLGDRLHYLERALTTLDQCEAIHVKNVSSIYETEPIGFTKQPPFLNMVAQLETSLSPIHLLNCLQNIECSYGRKRDVKWGPRTLDLDILLYNRENMKSERLEIPHPRMKERSFVLIPLFELDPQLDIPLFSEPFRDVIAQLQDKEGVKLWRRCGKSGTYGLF